MLFRALQHHDLFKMKGAILEEEMAMASFDLDRFIKAQRPVYLHVLEELTQGRKQSHWMWFIFPQVAGLGFSEMARRYAIGSQAEATAYLAHDILGERLIKCTRLVMAAYPRPIREILGSPDDLKFRSSMTLFDAVHDRNVFAEAIALFYPGGRDTATINLLKPSAG